jgi:hypothetical protein
MIDRVCRIKTCRGDSILAIDALIVESVNERFFFAGEFISSLRDSITRKVRDELAIRNSRSVELR